MIPKFKAFRPNYGDFGRSVMTLPFTLADLQDQNGFEFEDGTCCAWDEFGLAHEDTVVLAATGYLDDSGFEIYSDDIVKLYVIDILDGYMTGVVKYCPNHGGFVVKCPFGYTFSLDYSGGLISVITSLHKADSEVLKLLEGLED